MPCLIRPASHPQLLKMPPRARFRYIILLNLAPDGLADGGGGGWDRHGTYFRTPKLALQALNYLLVLDRRDRRRVLGVKIRKVIVFRAGLNYAAARGDCFLQ